MQNYARNGGRKVKEGANKVAAKAKDTAKKAINKLDEYGVDEAYRYAKSKRSKKMNEDAKTNYKREYENTKLASDIDKAKSGVKKASDTIKKYGSTSLSSIKGAAKKAAKFVDDHDGGLTEAARYAKAKRKMKGSSSDSSAYLAKLEDEYKRSGVGRAASKVSSLAGSAKNSAGRNAKNAGEAVKNTAKSAGAVAKNAGEAVKNTAKSAGAVAKNTAQNVASQVTKSAMAKDYESAVKDFAKNGNKDNRVAMNRARREFENYCRSIGMDNDDIDATIDKIFNKHVK